MLYSSRNSSNSLSAQGTHTESIHIVTTHYYQLAMCCCISALTSRTRVRANALAGSSARVRGHCSAEHASLNCCLQVACTASCADNDREDNIETLCKRDTVCAQRTAALGFSFSGHLALNELAWCSDEHLAVP
eukprot:16180-Heterococcus_DN1.PRE.2